MTRKCVGATGDTSWNAMHCKKGIGVNVNVSA